MLTKFGKALNTKITSGNFLPYTGSAAGSNASIIPVKAPDGTDYYAGPYLYSYGGNVDWRLYTTSTKTSYTGSSSAGIALGSGDTPATENDYDLENQITSLTAIFGAVNVDYDVENEKLVCYRDITLTNATQNDIIVKEIGTYRSTYSGTVKGATTGNSIRSFLVDRTVLETPLTVPAGGAAVLRMSTAY